ncbi:MAG TPA: ATP-binding cassette domain-containing protein [Vicinamibacterales bacterium]|nr:ATP-binding cassette domain-containing protein [Vicinamibacterales bacterium]
MAVEIAIDFSHRFPGGREIAASIRHGGGPGSILVLFGPSGAGKTTVVRAVAGLIRPAEGRIAVDGDVWLDSASGVWRSPQQRRTAYVAQEALLFPHLTARANVAYGLARGPERDRRADEVLRQVGVSGLAGRRASRLSGGEAQRVALARALAVEPRLLLLDEPFNALDAATRRQLRADVRALVRSTGTSAVLVTHDRLEAVAMGDAIAVMIEGRVRQSGPMADVFAHPADGAVAQALGIETVVPAVVRQDDHGLVAVTVGDVPLLGVADAAAQPGDAVFVCIRAEDVVIEPRGPSGGSARNHLPGVVRAIEPEGPLDRVTVDCGFPVVALITRRSREALALAPGSEVAAAVKATAIQIVT